jgi:hypothetical protein
MPRLVPISKGTYGGRVTHRYTKFNRLWAVLDTKPQMGERFGQSHRRGSDSTSDVDNEASLSESCPVKSLEEFQLAVVG